MADSLTAFLGPAGNPFRVMILIIVQLPFIAFICTLLLRYSVDRFNKMARDNPIDRPSMLKGFGCSLVYVTVNFLALFILNIVLKQWGWNISQLAGQMILSPYLILINALILMLALPESFKRAFLVSSIFLLMNLIGTFLADVFGSF